MIKYEKVIIKNNQQELEAFTNVEVDIVVHSNEGAVSIKGGQYNKLIDLVGGENYFTISLKNIAYKIKNKSNDKVDVWFIDDIWQIQIQNVSLQYKLNDVNFETKNFKVLKIDNK